jgi:hypothetical protein
MLMVMCHTNLDLDHETWPAALPALPNVGDSIQSATVWPNGFQLSLKVCGIRWCCHNREWVPHIELHTRDMISLREFYEWYAPKVGKTVESFI